MNCLYIEEYTKPFEMIVPHHIAIVMDGNRRWARQKGQPPETGHFQGAETLFRIVKEADRLGVKVLTVYSFSTENWNRSKKEIDVLMELLQSYLEKMEPEFISAGVKLDTIGDLSAFPRGVREELTKVKEATRNSKGLNLILALNYGGRDDIRRAVIKAADDYKNGKWSAQSLTEERLAQYLDTANWPDPELLIRTSGEFRVSNFLLWQISYSEVYLTDVLWPDFTEEQLQEAILAYGKRQRRCGE